MLNYVHFYVQHLSGVVMILGIAEVRKSLPKLVRDLSTNPAHPPVLIGAHRKAQVKLVPANSGMTIAVETLRRQARIISALAKAHNLSTVYVFGSVAKNTNTENSDVDLLCDGTNQTTLYDVAGFELVMEDLLGRDVNVLTRDSLDKKLDREIIESAIRIC